MLTNNVNNILQELNISNREGRIYSILLENPDSSATQLSTLANIPRTSIYHTINVLLQKGYLIEIKTKGKKRYSSMPPKALLKHAKKNILKAHDTERQIKKIVSLFESKSAGRGERKNIEVLYGLNGAWHLLENVLFNRKNSYWIAGTNTPFNKIITEKDYFRRITHRRKRMRKTLSYIIADCSPFSQKLKNQEDTDFRQVKILSKPTVLDGTIIIYGNKVGMISYGDELKTIMIEDSRLTDLFRLFHSLIWDCL